MAVVPHGYERPENGVQRIVAAFSPSPEGYEAIHAGVALARAGGAKLRVITAHETETGETSSEGMLAHEHHDADSRSALAARHRVDAEALLREAVAESSGGLEVETDVFGEDPAEALVGVSRHTDLIVMGSRARAPRRAVSARQRLAQGHRARRVPGRGPAARRGRDDQAAGRRRGGAPGPDERLPRAGAG